MKTHWKKLTNPNYLGSWDFDENEKRAVTILSIGKEKLKASPQAEEEECVVAQLKDSKPMVMNKTNLKAIEKALGTPHVEDWAGKSITLYVTQVKAFGSVVDALRVEPVAPRVVEKKPLSAARFNKAITALKEGKIEKLSLYKFALTEAQEKELSEL